MHFDKPNVLPLAAPTQRDPKHIFCSCSGSQDTNAKCCVLVPYLISTLSLHSMIWAKSWRRAFFLHIRRRPPWLIQHVLIVLVFWPRVLLVPASSRSPRLCPGTSVFLMVHWTFTWICCPQLPCHPCKQGTHSIGFCYTRGHTPNTIFRSKPQGQGRASSELQITAGYTGIVFFVACNSWIARVLCAQSPKPLRFWLQRSQMQTQAKRKRVLFRIAAFLSLSPNRMHKEAPKMNTINVGASSIGSTKL